MKTGDTVLEVDSLVHGCGYAILSTDHEKPLFRMHLTQEDFDKLGDTPLTLVGAEVKSFVFDHESKCMHAAFIRTDNTLVVWRLSDPTGNGFQEYFDDGSMHLIDG
jgi:hypothetical protein